MLRLCSGTSDFWCTHMGSSKERRRVSYHIPDQTAKKSAGHVRRRATTHDLPQFVAIEESNGRLLSPEPVVVEVSPDSSASTMTGGAESSLSGTLDGWRATDAPGCFCWCGSCQVSERIWFEALNSKTATPIALAFRGDRHRSSHQRSACPATVAVSQQWVLSPCGGLNTQWCA